MDKDGAYKRIDGASEPVEVSEAEYVEALSVLPPIYLDGKETNYTRFAVSEIRRHQTDGRAEYYCFAEIRGKYFGTRGTLGQAVMAFNEMAEVGKAIDPSVVLDAVNKEDGHK